MSTIHKYYKAIQHIRNGSQFLSKILDIQIPNFEILLSLTRFPALVKNGVIHRIVLPLLIFNQIKIPPILYHRAKSYHLDFPHHSLSTFLPTLQSHSLFPSSSIPNLILMVIF